jgi:hypothetical protein
MEQIGSYVKRADTTINTDNDADSNDMLHTIYSSWRATAIGMYRDSRRLV